MARILIIDDDHILTSMLAGQVSAAGHQVDEVHNLTRGLASVNDGAYDVVLLELIGNSIVKVLNHFFGGLDSSVEILESQTD